MLSVMFKINFAKNLSVLSHVNNALSMFCSLRGRRSKGKGKGIRGRDRARGRREEGGGEPFLSPSRAQIPPSPSPFNACHAGYVFRKQRTLPMLTAKTHGNLSTD